MGIWKRILGAITHDRRPSRSAVGRQENRRNAEPAGQATALLDEPKPTEESPSSSEEVWWAPPGATLTEPTEIHRPDLTTEARALENLLVSHFDGHDLSMPPLMHVAQRVLDRLRKRDCDFRRVAKDIAEDQVMAAAVLRMSNSPLYRGLHKTATVQAAVARLGAKALRTLMMHQSLRAIVFDGNRSGARFAARLWSRSLASACIMRALSRFTGLDEESAFLIGLLHDIGNVIVLRIMLRNDTIAQFDIDPDTFDYLCHECHQEFGELIAREWKLPSDLTRLICDHHTYPAPEDPLRTQRLQLQLADMINAMLGYAPPQTYDLLNARVVRDLGLAERQNFVDCLEKLSETVADSVSAL